MRNERNSNEILEEIVRERVQKIKKFYVHLVVFSIALLVYILKTYFGFPFNFWPIRFINAFFMWCWAFIIVVQAIRLIVKQSLLGKRWENQKIHEIMEKEKIKKQNWE
ncbi:2TM domain-containing protein [Flavobacterium sp. 9AF]|uniref:2TM domain-containing protein n=1 Tax=Flavobacterium sp. 9AF TaxID=2653142 RepID=UPI0013599131|nr:2TM domain-containing protein [Flavobacterium sp. 9AF]